MLARRTFAAFAVSAVIVGCSGGVDTVLPRGEDIDGDLERARSFGVPVYFVGREFADLPLTDVELSKDGGTLFFYGSCEIPAAQTDGGCAVPLEIQIFPFKPGAWRRATGCHRRPTLMGVPTVRHDGLVLFTRQTVIKIYGRSPGEERLVALALRDVRHPERSLRKLPAPAPNVEALLSKVCRGNG